MNHRLTIDPEALDEIDEAAEWYGSRSRRVSSRFLADVDDAIRAVHRHPFRFPLDEWGARHFVMTTYPYTVIYTVDDEVVLIVSVFHQRRDPDEWRRRL